MAVIQIPVKGLIVDTRPSSSLPKQVQKLERRWLVCSFCEQFHTFLVS